MAFSFRFNSSARCLEMVEFLLPFLLSTTVNLHIGRGYAVDCVHITQKHVLF